MNLLFLSNWERTETWIATAAELERRGHRCYFSVTRNTYVQMIRRAGFADDRILWLTRQGARAHQPCSAAVDLAELERRSGEKAKNFILMDRFLRSESQNWAWTYTLYVFAKIREFIELNNISLAIGQPDNVADLLAETIVKDRGGRYAAPFEMRLPVRRFMLWDGKVESQPHVTGAATLADITDEEREEARDVRDRVVNGQKMRQVAVAAERAGGLGRLLKRLFRGFLHRALIVSRHDVYMYTLRSALFDLKYHLVPFNRWLITLFGKHLFEAPVPSERFVFYALNFTPEHTLDVEAPNFTSAYETVRAIARSLPANVPLYVKEHPVGVGLRSPRELRRLGRLPGVRLIAPDHDSHALIKAADLTVSLSGTVCLEAALYGRQTAVVADIFIQNFSTCRRLSAPWEVGDALTAPPLLHRPDDDLRYLAWLISNSHAGTVIEPLTDPASLEPGNIARVADGISKVAKLFD
jgi:hypothetical protein